MAQHGDGRPPGLGQEMSAPWEERPASHRSRRRGRGRGTRRRAAHTRWTPKRLGLLGAAALAVLLAVALLLWLLGRDDEAEEQQAAEEEGEDATPEELFAQHPLQEHEDLAEVPAWDPEAHGLDENMGELCQTAGELAAEELADYDLVNTGPNYCSWEGAELDGAVPTLQLMLFGPMEDTEEAYVEHAGEHIRAALEAPGGVEAGPVYALPAEDEGFIRQAVEGSGDQATAEVHTGIRHGGYVTLVSVEEAPVDDEERLYAELTEFLTALAD
jgi:hypothetical protein